MKVKRHMSVNIQGLLNNSKRKKLTGLFEDENGESLSDKEARMYLQDCLAKGWKLIPTGECDGFDHFENGCPGHPYEDK